MGTAVSQKAINEILKNDELRILLIRSGKLERYWAYIKDIQNNVPFRECIPDYYRNMSGLVRTWFRIGRFEPVNKDIMSRCIVISSGAMLSEGSKHSMSPYFKIEYFE